MLKKASAVLAVSGVFIILATAGTADYAIEKGEIIAEKDILFSLIVGMILFLQFVCVMYLTERR